MQEIIELTTQQVQSFNSNEKVFLFENEFVHFSISKNKNEIYSYRNESGKKYGSYNLSANDIISLNLNQTIFFYDGKIKLYLKKNSEVNLQ